MLNANYYIHFLTALEDSHLDSCFPNLEPVDQTEDRSQTRTKSLTNALLWPKVLISQLPPQLSSADQIKLEWKIPLAYRGHWKRKWNHNSPLCCLQSHPDTRSMLDSPGCSVKNSEMLEHSVGRSVDCTQVWSWQQVVTWLWVNHCSSLSLCFSIGVERLN